MNIFFYGVNNIKHNPRTMAEADPDFSYQSDAVSNERRTLSKYNILSLFV